jgi:site-specific recombinase XerD
MHPRLADQRGPRDLTSMSPESLWPRKGGTGITTGLFYGNLRRNLEAAGLPPSGAHVLRHAAAKLRGNAGQSIEEVSRFLDHSSMAVTSAISVALRSPKTGGWAGVAQAIGI